MPNPIVPANSEQYLANQPVAARLANIYDILNSIFGALGGGSGLITPVAFTGAYSIAAGGTAQNLISGTNCIGGFLVNPITATENLYVDMVGSPASTDAIASGTTTQILQPGDVFIIPAIKSGVTVKVNAATTGHKLNGCMW